MKQAPEGKTFQIRLSSEAAAPYLNPLVLYAYLAFPNDDETEVRLLAYQALLLQWHMRDMDPVILGTFSNQKYLSIRSKISRRVEHRLSAGRIALFQILKLKREGFAPSLQNQEQMERILLGWNPETVASDSTYKTKVWGRSRRVLHVATALCWTAAYNSVYNGDTTTQQIVLQLVSNPADFDWFLDLAENIRFGLPSVNRMYRHEQFLAIKHDVCSTPPLIDQSLSMEGFRRPFFPFGPASEARSGRLTRNSLFGSSVLPE